MLNTIRKKLEKVKHPKRKLKVSEIKTEPLTYRIPSANIQVYNSTIVKDPLTMLVTTKSPFAKVTKEYIVLKARRQRNPIHSLVGLAREAGISVYGTDTKTTVSGAFRLHVMKMLGKRDYQKFLKGTL